MRTKKLILFPVLLMGSFLLGFSQVKEATPFKVGAAKVDITPSKDSLPKGYNNIHDDLYARAIVIDNGTTSAALVSVDRGMLSNDFYDTLTGQIEKELGIPAHNIFVSASHTHSAPWQTGPKVIEGAFNAVKQAKGQLKPARVSYATGLAYLNINRDVIDPVTRLWSQGPNYDGPSDKTVAVIKFEALNGDLIAVYYNYAMHANTMFMSGSISADFPGVTSKYIEDYYGNNVVALFSSGAAGDQNPISVRPMLDVSRTKSNALLASGKAKDLSDAIMKAGFMGESDVKIAPEVLARQTEMISSLGQLLGEEVLRVLDLPQRSDSVIQIYGSQETVTCPGRTRTNTGREGAPGTYVPGDPVHIKLCLLKLGDVALASVNAEVYNIIGQEFKKESPINDIIFATLTNGAANSGYIPSDDAFQRYTFQVLSSRLEPNCAETSIINGLLDLIDASK